MKKSGRSEFEPLYRRLTVFYTVATGAVLTVLLAAAFWFGYGQNKDAFADKLSDCFSVIQNKLFEDASVSDLWLARYEADNGLVINVYDNGKPIFYKSSAVSADEHDFITEKALEQLSNYNIDIFSRPYSVYPIESEVYSVYGSDGEKYNVYAACAASGEGFRSFLLFRRTSDYNRMQAETALIYLIIGLVGIALSFFIGRVLAKKMLAPLKENRQRQTEFIAAASHELKSPLAVIRAQNSAENAENSKQIIENECIRMAKLIYDLLLLAACDAQSWSVRRERVSAEEVIAEAYEMFALLARDKKITAEFSLPDEILPDICGDRQRIIQILSVLTDNAVAYSENGGKIRIVADSVSGFVSVSVIDYGKGIPDEEKERVFERFKRLDKSRSDKNRFGLGLSIAKELTSIMHGRITLADTDGGGCTFTVFLPVWAE